MSGTIPFFSPATLCQAIRAILFFSPATRLSPFPSPIPSFHLPHPVSSHSRHASALPSLHLLLMALSGA